MNRYRVVTVNKTKGTIATYVSEDSVDAVHFYQLEIRRIRANDDAAEVTLYVGVREEKIYKKEVTK